LIGEREFELAVGGDERAELLPASGEIGYLESDGLLSGFHDEYGRAEKVA
jgi:hypothetical protein